MNKILIKSNPYEQEIRYSRYDDNVGKYLPITCEDSSSSKLHSINYIKCFFPFKAKEILCHILNEYGDINGNLEIVFEGSSDEFDELLEVQKSDNKFHKTIISKGQEYLEDGRDVIKQINDIFKDIEPIVKDSVSNNESVNKNLKKYSDAANDIIPICVIGNTNMGKSTFINALLGAEYLPQDKNRCTAKIYKITQSSQSDRANIKFDYKKLHVSVVFKSSFEIFGELPTEFENEIRLVLNEEKDSSLSNKITRLLKFLNLYDENNHTQAISDLIELEVPFNSDVFQKSNNPFVIFDTPGSNYAGNEKDAELLKEQMKDLTNGLPIFVTDYNGLPTKDNYSLIEELQSFEELDQRFTILVVNKADTAKLDDEEVERIKGEPVPSKLALRGLQGIYFVSSIMGLGYKNKCHFLDKQDVRLFHKNVSEYDESDDDYVLRLYKFNIIPDQLKNKFEQGISQDMNPVYLNSGLYSIEKEIETYANKYSAYNKCQQSYLFLKKIFSETTEEIERQTNAIINQRNALNSNFDKEKRELIEKLQQEVDEKEATYDKMREEQIKETLAREIVYFEEQELKAIEEEIFKQQEQKRNIATLDTNYEQAKTNRRIEFQQDITEAGRIIISFFKGDKTLSDFEKQVSRTVTNLTTNTQKVDAEHEALIDNKTEAEQETYNRALADFEKMYYDIASKNQNEIYEESKGYWETNSNELKDELIKIVAMSEALAEDQKKLVQEIIATYEMMNLEKQDIGDPQKKKYRSLLSNRIDVSKLGANFNKAMKNSIAKLYKDTQNRHKEVFENWVNELLNVIRLSIGEMNPTLKLYQDKIKELTNRKQQLERNRLDLENYTNAISEMISWKE